MLSISNVRKINNQIADELRNVDSILTSHHEKMEAIERINALKKLLSDRPEVEKPEPTVAPARPTVLETICGMMPQR
jgi:hypothetical protein